MDVGVSSPIFSIGTGAGGLFCVGLLKLGVEGINCNADLLDLGTVSE